MEDSQRAGFEAAIGKGKTYTERDFEMFRLGYHAALASPEVQALRKEAKRLQFIEDDNGETVFRQSSQWFTAPARYPSAAIPKAKRHKTMRDAIDAAMEKHK